MMLLQLLLLKMWLLEVVLDMVTAGLVAVAQAAPGRQRTVGDGCGQLGIVRLAAVAAVAAHQIVGGGRWAVDAGQQQQGAELVRVGEVDLAHFQRHEPRLLSDEGPQRAAEAERGQRQEEADLEDEGHVFLQ